MLASVIIHETVHIIRQKNINPIWWLVRYILDPKFRLEVELVAIYCQMKYLKSLHMEYDIDRKVRQFARGEYFWLMTHIQSEKILRRLWEGS